MTYPTDHVRPETRTMLRQSRSLWLEGTLYGLGAICLLYLLARMFAPAIPQQVTIVSGIYLRCHQITKEVMYCRRVQP